MPSRKITGRVVSFDKASLSSNIHLDAACIFTFGTYEIGKYYDTHPKDGEYSRKAALYRASVVGALYTSVAFLEAAINEVLLDAEYCARPSTRQLGTKIIPRGAVEGLSPNVIELMAQMWVQQQKYNSWPGRSHLEKYLDKNNPGNNIQHYWPTLDKYQLALALNKKRPIGKSNRKRRNVSLLRDFRNYLTHAKTELAVAHTRTRRYRGDDFTRQRLEKQETVRLERRIKALLKSDKNGSYDSHAHENFIIRPYFPYNCLTANFAKMAVKSSLEFYTEFSKRMGVRDIEALHFLRGPPLSAIFSL